LDFSTNQRFSSSEIGELTRFVNEIVDRDEPVHIFHHQDEPEAWYWKCLNTIYPRGGTHRPSAKYVGPVILKRKNMGENLERIIAKYPNAHIPQELYHEFKRGGGMIYEQCLRQRIH
jgi:alanyl-tRNA synthetase